jgi:glycerate kinase
MRVVAAPDKFKGCLPAPAVARAITADLRAADPGLDVAELPVVDGGDGTLTAASAAGFRRVPVTAEEALSAPSRSKRDASPWRSRRKSLTVI